MDYLDKSVKLLQEFEPLALGLNDPELLSWLGIDPDEASLRGKDALKETSVYSCIRILSGAVGKLPLKIYQNNGNLRKANDHYSYNLLKLRPNEYMSAIDFFKCLEVQRNIYGNAYAYIERAESGRDRGNIVGLYPLDSSKVEIVLDSDGLYDSANRLWYVVMIEGKPVKLKQRDVLHFKGLACDGISGVSPITNLRTIIQSANAGANYVSKFFENGLQVKGLLEYTGDLGEEGEIAIKQNFEKMSNGLKNAHRIALMPPGLKFQPLKMTLVDAQFLENTQLTIRMIAAAFGVKMHQINDLARATHSNISEQQREFYIDTLMDILTIYEQELTYKLFAPEERQAGFYVKFNADAITRADIKTRYDAYRTGIHGGFLTPNEVRDREELEYLEFGDELYANGSMVKLKDVGRSA